jgi:hypothetical protein
MQAELKGMKSEWVGFSFSSKVLLQGAILYLHNEIFSRVIGFSSQEVGSEVWLTDPHPILLYSMPAVWFNVC